MTSVPKSLARQKFSKVSRNSQQSAEILKSQQKFSKVSTSAHGLCTATIDSTFQNLCSALIAAVDTLTSVLPGKALQDVNKKNVKKKKPLSVPNKDSEKYFL